MAAGRLGEQGRDHVVLGQLVDGDAEAASDAQLGERNGEPAPIATRLRTSRLTFMPGRPCANAFLATRAIGATSKGYTLIAVSLNVLLVNLLVDILYGFLDPRVRVQK